MAENTRSPKPPMPLYFSEVRSPFSSPFTYTFRLLPFTTMAMCFHEPTASAPPMFRRFSVSQPAENVPSELAWNRNSPQPGPAIWFQLSSELQFIQNSMVAWFSFAPNTSGTLKPDLLRFA